MEELEKQRKEALENVDSAYYDSASEHYRDNDRYKWAVGLINNEFARLKADLKMQQDNCQANPMPKR